MEKGYIQGSTAIDVCLDSPFAGESLHEGFIFPVSDKRFLLQVFLSAVVMTEVICCFFNSILVEPLRLFHPTVLRCVEGRKGAAWV